MQFKWWKLQKGMGIRVKMPNDIDKETGKQKYRPAIVIKSYPSHVKVQLMTTEPSNHDYFKIKIDNQIQYIRPIYCRTIPFEWINQKWIDINNNIIKIDRKNKIFQKIAAKEYKEISDQNLDLTKIKNLETKIQKLEKENQEFKKQICVQVLKLKNRNHG